MDLYDLVQFGHTNPNDDLIKHLKNDFDTEISNDIREYEWNQEEDAFWDGASKETKIEEVMKNPKKNNRRINIPDAEVKHFHNRFYNEDEGYYEHPERDEDPTETPIEDGYNQLPTESKRYRKQIDEKVNER